MESIDHKRIRIEDVEITLARPRVWRVQWIGQEEVIKQLLAAWMVVDRKDLPFYPRLVGKPGVGKTTLLLNVALADIRSGQGLCFLDPHGGVTEQILRRIPQEREQDVILWDPLDVERPFGLNLFECSDVGNPAVVDRMSDVFYKALERVFPESFRVAPRMSDLLRNLAIVFVENQGYTLAETWRFLTNRDYRAPLLSRLTNPQARDF